MQQMKEQFQSSPILMLTTIRTGSKLYLLEVFFAINKLNLNLTVT